MCILVLEHVMIVYVREANKYHIRTLVQYTHR